jgi:uncharacterized membrane protein
MLSLVVAVVFWIAIHLLIAGRFRPAVAGALGPMAFRGLFSVLSALGLAWLIWAYGRAPHVELWPASPALALVPLAVMPFAFVFFVGGLSGRNPTMAGADMMLKAELPVHGMTRVTRHPMLWSFALWAAAHLVANGDLASLLMFGAILITAVNGMASIDRKRRQANPAQWDAFAAVTSRLPFAAIVEGRNAFVWPEIGAGRIALALALYLLALALHRTAFGVAVWPF